MLHSLRFKGDTVYIHGPSKVISGVVRIWCKGVGPRNDL